MPLQNLLIQGDAGEKNDFSIFTFVMFMTFSQGAAVILEPREPNLPMTFK